MEYNLKTIEEISIDIATRMKSIRKLKKITQKDLSLRANVSLSSVKRWEEDGEINILSFIKIARVLGIENEFDNLFKGNFYNNIDEVIRDNK